MAQWKVKNDRCRNNNWKLALPAHFKSDQVINVVLYWLVLSKPELARNINYENIMIFTHWILSQYEQNDLRNDTYIAISIHRCLCLNFSF